MWDYVPCTEEKSQAGSWPLLPLLNPWKEGVLGSPWTLEVLLGLTWSIALIHFPGTFLWASIMKSDSPGPWPSVPIDPPSGMSSIWTKGICSNPLVVQLGLFVWRNSVPQSYVQCAFSKPSQPVVSSEVPFLYNIWTISSHTQDFPSGSAVDNLHTI